MRSRRALGGIALTAVIVAAVSFAVVDVSTSAASGCIDAVLCTERTLPPIAIVFAVIGSVALVAGIVPALTWLVSAIATYGGSPSSDPEYRRPAVAYASDDDFD